MKYYNRLGEGVMLIPQPIQKISSCTGTFIPSCILAFVSIEEKVCKFSTSFLLGNWVVWLTFIKSVQVCILPNVNQLNTYS